MSGKKLEGRSRKKNNSNIWIVKALQSIKFDFIQIKSQAAKVNLASEILILALVVINYLATKGETIVLYVCSVFRPELIDRVNKQTSYTGLFAFLAYGIICFIFVFFVKPYFESKKIIPPDFNDND